MFIDTRVAASLRRSDMFIDPQPPVPLTPEEWHVADVGVRCGVGWT